MMSSLSSRTQANVRPDSYCPTPMPGSVPLSNTARPSGSSDRSMGEQRAMREEQLREVAEIFMARPLVCRMRFSTGPAGHAARRTARTLCAPQHDGNELGRHRGRCGTPMCAISLTLPALLLSAVSRPTRHTARHPCFMLQSCRLRKWWSRLSHATKHVQLSST